RPCRPCAGRGCRLRRALDAGPYDRVARPARATTSWADLRDPARSCAPQTYCAIVTPSSMTRPWHTVARVDTAEGALELRRRGDADFLITIAGRVLMTSQARRSEEALATLPLRDRPPPRVDRVLIGGLGMGYTLRAALDVLPATARVTVVELNADVAAWCRGPLAPLTDGAVADSRVTIVVGDVAAHV